MKSPCAVAIAHEAVDKFMSPFLFIKPKSRLCFLPRYRLFPVAEASAITMKCSGENVKLDEIFHVVSCFPLHFMLYRGNVDCFSNSV